MNNAVSQYDMNATSLGLYDLWDIELNELYRKLKYTLPDGDFEILKVSQKEWIDYKEAIAATEGKNTVEVLWD